MPLLGWEETVTCPYNNAHQISKSKLITHLVKCRRNNPDAGIEICSFNSTHHIPRDQMAEHEKNCESAKQIAYLMSAPMPSSSFNAPVSNAVPDMGIDDEDWEAEATITKSYDPSKKTQNRSILRKKEGATPSERREFRKNERIRLEELEDKLSNQLSKTSLREEPARVPNFNNNDRPKGIGRGRGVILCRDKWTLSRNARGSVSTNQSCDSDLSEAWKRSPHSDSCGNQQKQTKNAENCEKINVPKGRGRGRVKWGMEK